MVRGRAAAPRGRGTSAASWGSPCRAPRCSWGSRLGNGWADPDSVGLPTVRIEVFVDDPDAFVARAAAAGGNVEDHPLRDHAAPWGTHRQGGFVDPFGHLWFVGDRSPLHGLREGGSRADEAD